MSDEHQEISRPATMDWLPAYFKNPTVCYNYVKGYVDTEEELQSLIEIHRRQFNCSFVYGNDDKSKKNKTTFRVVWNHRHIGVWRNEKYPGLIHPFCVIHSVIRACQYGKAHSRPKKRKPVKEEPDHSYPVKKKLRVEDMQNTRKCDCTAKIFIQRVRRFDRFAIEENAGRRVKEITMDHVNVETDNNVTELIFVSLPLEEAHDTHIISRESGSCQRVKPEVREKILSLVASGITSTAVVKLLLERYVLEEMNHPGGILPANSDNGYFPKNSDIMNYIRRGRVQVHNPASDLQNLENEMQERRVQEGESLDLSTSFRISSNLTLDNGFLPAEIELDNSGSVLSEKQAALREKLKLLTDLTYITTDLTVLQTASSALDSCIEIMQTSIKEENDKRKHTEKQVKVKSQPVRSQSCQKECSRLKKKQKVNNVSCNKSPDEVKDYPTVLAEFLSVVTDTQEYIMPAPESTNDLLIEQEAQQATKYILVNDFGRQETQQIQNMETVSSADGSNLQVSDGMKIVQR